MKKSLIVAMLGALVFALAALPAWAQTVSAQVEGTVTEGSKPLPNVQVTLTNKGTGKVIKIKTDKNGKFIAVGVPYGAYEVEVTSSSGEKLFHQNETQVAPGETSAASVMKIDINETKSSSGQAGQSVQGTPSGQTGQGQPGQAEGGKQPKYTKEQIEEIKKQNAKAESTNALIKQAMDAIQAKNWQAAQEPLQQLITADPNNWQYQSAMGDVYLNLGQFDQAVDAYQKGIQAAESNTGDPKNPANDPAKKKAGEAKMLTNQGNAYIKLHKNAEAAAAFTKAASMDPNPSVAYWNLCATQYNTGNVEGALDACDKAIAADPNRADAYFIKGSLLIAGSKTDPSGKVIAPPGTAEALNKYLELQPDGAHAADVKQMLAYIGSKIENTYKKRGK